MTPLSIVPNRARSQSQAENDRRTARFDANRQRQRADAAEHWMNHNFDVYEAERRRRSKSDIACVCLGLFSIPGIFAITFLAVRAWL